MEKQQADMEKQLGLLKELQGRLDALSSFKQQKRVTEELESDEEEGEYGENEADAGDYSLGMSEDPEYGEVAASKGSLPAAAKKPKEKRSINDRLGWTGRQGNDDLFTSIAPLEESSSDVESSSSDSEDDSDDDGSSESDEEENKKKKKEKEKEKKTLESERIFKEPMGRKKKMRDYLLFLREVIV